MASRAARTPLSRERVLGAAVAIADAEGLKALTMRRLAADLEVEAMSLYYHLPAKEALLDGVVETVLAEVLAAVAPIDGPDWRGRLRAQFLEARRVMLRHPWAPGLISTRRSVPPMVYAYYDGIVGTMTGAGFSYRLAHRALHSFGSMTLGFVQEIFNPAENTAGNTAGDSTGNSAQTGANAETRAKAETRANVETGADAESRAPAESRADDDLAAMAALVPNLTAMLESEVHAADDPTLGWCDSQIEFEFTLDLLLEGLERRRG